MSTTAAPTARSHVPHPALTDREADPRRAPLVQAVAVLGTAMPVLLVALWAVASQL